MSRRSNKELKPRNGHTLVAGIVARISGCANQKEMSLEDQVDHGKEDVAELYDGPVEWVIIATKGKGERLDRPELDKIEKLLRAGRLDILDMEDVGRLVRGADAVRLWGIAVDHETWCIAPNDCVDTADENWEQDLIEACADHVGHNAHTSKRLKHKLMNRFKKHGGATALPTAGYSVPEGAETYHDWVRVDNDTPTIRAGIRLLRETLNCSAVADYFNAEGFAVGPYCRNKVWDGRMVRRFYGNPLLAGKPRRGVRHTIKHYETGRRISVPNTESDPVLLDCPHLGHVDFDELLEVNALLEESNKNFSRHRTNGVDKLARRPRKRTRRPGQHARCWYCGREFVWGGNGVTANLMCAGPRCWKCWNAISINGKLTVARLVGTVIAELASLDRVDAQLADMVELAMLDGDVPQQRASLETRLRQASCMFAPVNW